MVASTGAVRTGEDGAGDPAFDRLPIEWTSLNVTISMLSGSIWSLNVLAVASRAGGIMSSRT